MTLLFSIADLKTELNTVGQTADNSVLDRLGAVASDSFQRVTGYSFLQPTPVVGAILYPPAVQWAGDGRLLARVPLPHLTAVAALAYRVGSPAAAWVPVDSTGWDFNPTEDRTDTVIAYLAPPPVRRPLWARISYTAGWPDAASLPGDVQEAVLWWAMWLYRSKDAPFERTSNPLTGTVTIPSKMPIRIRAIVDRWTRTVVA